MAELPPLPSGAVMMPPLPAGAELVSAGAAPEAATAPKTWMERVKGALIAPEGERDKSLGESAKKAFSPSEILKAMGHDFASSVENIPGDVFPNTPEKFRHAEAFGPLGAIGMDLAGAVASPVTGALSNISRIGEYETGVRRNVIGDVASMFVPLGGEAKAASEVGRIEKGAEALKPMAEEARKQGYVLPPQMITKNPGVVADVLGGWSGKIKTQQAASVKNQEVTNGLAAKSIGLPEDTHLTDKVFEDVRKEAGKAYTAVKTSIPVITPDEKFDAAVGSLGGANSHAAEHFPGIINNKEVLSLIDALKKHEPFPTEAGIEVVKDMRFKAKENLKAQGNPGAHALGLAQRQAADAMDDLIERNIAEAGGGQSVGLVKAYKDARQLIAKSYDLEGATNKATGNVNALGIARLGAKGKPLTGELKTISDIASAFPKAMQPETRFGGNEELSALDFFGSAAAIAHGSPEVAGMIMGRPLARKALLSKGMQDKLAAVPKAGPSAGSVVKKLYRPAVGASAANTIGSQPMNFDISDAVNGR